METFVHVSVSRLSFWKGDYIYLNFHLSIGKDDVGDVKLCKISYSNDHGDVKWCTNGDSDDVGDVKLHKIGDDAGLVQVIAMDEEEGFLQTEEFYVRPMSTTF